jgi:hypothetical protein
MSAIAFDLRTTAGYIVADRRGRVVGKVECPMYGTAPDVPDALSVRSGLFARRRRMVPADTIDQIDGTSGVIGLRVDRESIRSSRPHRRDALTTTSCRRQLAVGRQPAPVRRQRPENASLLLQRATEQRGTDRAPIARAARGTRPTPCA